MRLRICWALVGRSACPWVYRWADIFARPVLVYAPVDECVDECAYVYVCVYAPVHEYVAVAVYVCVHPSIHLCARAEN